MNSITNMSGNQNNQTKVQMDPANQMGQHHGKHHKKVENEGMNFAKIFDAAQKTNNKVK